MAILAISHICFWDNDEENWNLINYRLRNQEFDLSRKIYMDIDIDYFDEVEFIFFQDEVPKLMYLEPNIKNAKNR